MNPNALRKKMPMYVSMALLTIFAAGSTIAPVSAADEKPAIPSQVRQQTAAGVHPVTEAAVKAGALSCTTRINQVANFLTAGNQEMGALMFTPPAPPDQNLISVSMEILTAEASTAYASASFAPNQAAGCTGMYETVVYWPQGCTDVAAKKFAGLKKAATLSKTISVLDAGPSTKIFLMPAGKGCVSIKKEIVR